LKRDLSYQTRHKVTLTKIVGVVYPVPIGFVDRLFVEHRGVIVKYVARTTGLKIAPKHKVVFYGSKGSGEVVGEGTIDALEFLTPNEALEKFGDRLFLDKDELTKYTMHQPTRTLSKRVLVVTLSKLRRYPPGIKYERRMTMAGEYLTKERYDALLARVHASKPQSETNR